MFGTGSALTAAVSLLGLLAGRGAATDVNCACGYQDPVTGDLWTDTTIIYFNETTPEQVTTTPDFVSLNFTNPYEQGFDATYRQAAYPSNLGLTSDAMRLTLSKARRDHLSIGSGLRTARRDIQYASVRAYLQPPQIRGVGGSALSMYYLYNGSQSMYIDLSNGDKPGESMVNYRLSIPRANPAPVNYTYFNVSQDQTKVYDFNEWRFDWTKKRVSYGTSLNATASYNASLADYSHGMPSAPGAIYFKHWSVGSAQTNGPPIADVYAQIRYIRIFFNSTLTSTDENFGAQCRILQTDVCSTEDMTLRTSSTYPAEALVRWEQAVELYKPRIWAVSGVAVTGGLMLIIIIHAVIRRLYKHYSVPKELRPVHPPAYAYKLDRFALHGELTKEMIKEKKRNEKAEKKGGTNKHSGKMGDVNASPVIRSREIDPETASLTSFVSTEGGTSLRNFSSLSGNRNSRIIASAIPTMYYSRPGQPSRSRLAQRADEEDDEEEMDEDEEREEHDEDEEVDAEADEEYANLPTRPSEEIADRETAVAFAAQMEKLPADQQRSVMNTLKVPRPSTNFWSRFFRSKGSKVEEVKEEVIKANNRIDYLDGLRGLCCLLVSLVHYSLTFYHGFITPGPPQSDHYDFVYWIRVTIAPLFFTANFGIGVFFVLSSRLIGIRYLKTGLIQDLAGSTFRRVPRLAFPVLCAVVLTYFFIGVGAIEWLQYMPSFTWSTWPYATAFKNPGWFINEFFALLWVTPPTLPKIIYNYCTGVLWTIPVTIQGSWLIFLGVIIVKEIKNAKKRFFYYFCCMTLSWYALSWGSFFWFGLAVSDLDFMLKYRAWVGPMGPRKIAVVGALTAITLASCAINYLQSLDIIVLPVYEYGIHPDLISAKPIYQTPRWGYPEFQLPQVFSLFGAAGLLMLCDLSTGLQKVFNIKFLRVLGFYSYSVYLLHGLVFWSWGAWLTVRLGMAGIPYWANQIIVFTTSYGVLTLACVLWAPFADVFMMKGSTALWRWAQGRSFYATIH